MGFRGRLEITDGTTFIDLLGNASHSTFSLLEWEPSAPAPKGGGIWMDNPLLDGRQLAIRKESNIIDAFTIVAKGQTATDIHDAITTLRYMLNRAVGYWTNRARYPDPIYLLIQYPEESAPYWGLIYDYRMSNLTNPYTQPLYQSKKAVIPEFTLTVERSLRFPITGAACASLDIDYALTPTTQQNFFEPALSTDDAEVNWSALSLRNPNAITALWFSPYLGIPGSGERGYTGRVINVTISAGSIIKKAYLQVVSSSNQSEQPGNLYAAVELNVAPALFSTWANWIARTWSSELQLNPADIDAIWTAGANPGPKLTNAGGWESLIQQVIDLPGWASGNNLAFYLRNYDNHSRAIVGFDGAAGEAPELHVEWEQPTHDVNIVNATCADTVIGNKDPYNSIGDILVYDASGGTYTNLRGTALPWTLLPAVPAANDILYVACNYVDNDPQDMPFGSLVFNISTPDAGLGNINWEYWNGAAWASLSSYDHTVSFRVSGINAISWTIPANWARVAVNGITAFWVRGLVLVAGANPPVQATYDIFQSLRPYIDIPVNTNVLPIKFKLQANPVGSNGGGDNYSFDEAFICVRTLSRGEDFTPFINIVDTLNTVPTGIVVTHPVGTDTQLNTATTGRAVRYNPGGVVAETDFIMVAFYSDITRQYAGKFRVLLRRYGATDPENLSYRLKVSTEPTGPSSTYHQTALIPDTDNPDYAVIDFGVIDLGLFALNFSRFFLTVSGAASAAADVYWNDLILLPVDEMAIRAYQLVNADITAWIEGYYNRLLTVDSITDNEERAYIEEEGNLITNLLFETNRDIRLDTTIGGNRRIWFFFGGYITGCTNYQRRYNPGIIAGITLRILPEKI